MKKTIIISVIICTFNPTKFFLKTIESILNQTVQKEIYEIIIVDDGSEIDIHKFLNAYLKELIILRISPNKGLGYARSEGIKLSVGEYIAFTDDDCIVEKNWLEKILDGYKIFKDADGIGGKILPYSQDSILELYAYRSKNPLYAHIPHVKNKDRIKSYLKKFYSSESNQIRNGQLLDSIMGLNSSYKRNLILEIGSTDPNFKRGVDWDLNMRLREKNAKFYYKEDAIVYHRHRSTSLSFFKHIFSYAQAYVAISSKYESIKIIPYPLPILFLFLLILGLFFPIVIPVYFKNSLVIIIYFIIILSFNYMIYFIISLHSILVLTKEKRCIKCLLLFPLIEFLRELIYDLGIITGILK